MKRKTLQFCTSLVFSLILGFSLSSCKDNDLSDGGSNGKGTIETEADAQKYETLQTLLGALADVDSLPNNWNSSNYTVTPTVGVVNNEAEPHVRYVVTSSQAEADRIYRSYLSKDVTGTLADDSWQQDGIGSMQFHLETMADCYATLKVNVQQLPTLEEIRFVPAETLGNNGFLKPSGCYYNFGDVICQTVKDPSKPNGTQPTFWVCVRPCSEKESLRKTHWCTFQLVGPTNQEVKYDNFYKNDNIILPTNLCTKKADGERMVQNFFNVLRMLAKPGCVSNGEYIYQGIGEIKAEDFPYSDIRTIAYMWRYLDLWNKDRSFNYTIDGEANNAQYATNGGVINNSYDQSLTSLDQYLSDGGEVNAYYYGYKESSWYNRGDYNVYNLRLNLKNGGLYDKVKKQTYFSWKAGAYDFSECMTGAAQLSDKIYSTTSDKPADKYQFIVKYKTGAELEGANQDVDVDPANSFSVRSDKNGISDILVSGKWKLWPSFSAKQENQKYDEPFFAFGDKVSQLSLGASVNLTCIKSASKVENGLSDDEKYNAWFLTTGNDAITVKNPSANEAKLILFHLLNAYIQGANVNIGNDTHFVKKPTAINNDNQASTNYQQALTALYNRFIQGGQYVRATNDNNAITITVKFGGMRYAYSLTYNYGQDREEADVNAVLSLGTAQSDLSPLYLCTYNDQYKFYEEFSRVRTLRVYKKNERQDLKTQISNFEAQFMNNGLDLAY